LATKELVFGPQGTTGTDVTFILDINKGLPGVTLNKPLNTEAVLVTAHLYDYENNEIDLTEHQIEWGWKASNTVPLMQIVEENGVPSWQREIVLTSAAEPAANYHIL
jgi:hypothetical protein